MKRVIAHQQTFLYTTNTFMDSNMQTENLQIHHQPLLLCSDNKTTTMGEPMVLAASMDIDERNTTKRRRVEEDACMLMDCDNETTIFLDDNDNMEMNEQQQYLLSLLDLPTEMLAHIFSFLPLKDLCHSAEICLSTYSVVRSYTLSVALQVKCREFIAKNEVLIKDLIFAQNEHIEVLKKLVEFYRGEIPIPKTEVDKLQQRQAELHLTERTLAAQRDTIQRDITFYSDQYDACTQVKDCLTQHKIVT